MVDVIITTKAIIKIEDLNLGCRHNQNCSCPDSTGTATEN